MRHWAGTGRLEYLALRRLALGTSFWTGKTDAESLQLAPRLTLARAQPKGSLRD